ncbi:MAG: acyl-CoA dehydrogenase [Deltaproteobacteria bacterium]|nr:MAG: acyl-CoA dehydrogenase [Deltaproteobacteria bacterium]
MSERSTRPSGCAFLFHPVGTERVLTPEDFTDEQRLFARTAEEFMEREVVPHAEELERQVDGLMVDKLRKAGELGLLALDIPEEFGGLEVDKTTSMLTAEKLGTYASFSVSHGAHTGIGMLPLVFFGNQEQKARYLPRFATAEIIGAYALTEPGSGSDALGARCTAVPEKHDGRTFYRLNGTKMWITNAGFADLFTVFAKVDGEHFTAFLVEAGYEGVSTGAEEQKMGLKGSSTRLLVLEDVLVPEENVLGEVGRGHKIAFNILNVGRFKLGVGVLGAAKRTLGISVKYALERKQFGRPIGTFGAIREKLAQMQTRLYALESMCYRVAGYMDATIDTLDSTSPEYTTQLMAAIEEFAVEDSIMKIFGSEVLDFCVDEGVQIHGGLGYSREYEVERLYRDSRINRIFEGTNEINRMLIPGILLKRSMKGEIQLFEVIQRVEEAVATDKPELPAWEADGLAQEGMLVEKSKEIGVWVANLAIQKHMADLKDQQELLMAIADIITVIYAMDSTVSRVLQHERAGSSRPVHHAMAQVLVAEGYAKVLQRAQDVLPSLAAGEKLKRRFAVLDKFSFRPTTDLVAARRAIADAVTELGRFVA